MGTRSLLRPGYLGLICGLAAFLAGAAGWLRGLDAGAYDLGLRTRRPLPEVGEVAVVEIDDASMRQLGEWPWRWSQHGEFVRVLHEHYRPRAIVFDVLFIESDEPGEKAAFARAIEEAGNVYLAGYLSDFPGAGTAGREAPWLVGRYEGRHEWRGKDFASLNPPSRELAAAAAGVGPVNVVPELDGCIRRVPLVLEYEEEPYVSLIGVVLNGLVNAEGRPVEVKLGRSVDFGGTEVPIDGGGETLISYTSAYGGRPRAAFPHYGYEEVLSRSVGERALRDKVVFVGFAGAGLADVHPTPLAAGAFGVDINAHAVNGLAEGSYLREAGWLARLGLALMLGVLAALSAASWSPGRALAVTVVLMGWGLGFAALMLWWRGVWIGATGPALGALGAYMLTVAQRYRESERESLRMQGNVDAVAQATRVIASVRLRPELLSEVREQITDAVGARQTNLYLRDEAGGKVELVSAAGGEEAGVDYAIGEGTVGWVAEHGMMHLVRRVARGSALARELARTVKFAVGSVAYAAMEHRGEVLGVVEVVRREDDGPFDEAHLPVLQALASEAGVALRNVGLYEQLEGKVEIANRQLVSAYGELKQERDRVAAMVSNMADGVLLTDGEGRIVFINRAVEAMFGVESSEVEGKAVSDALPHRELLEQLGEEGPEVREGIPRIRLEQPRRLVLSPRTVRLVGEDGRRTGAVTVVSDITLLEELSEMKTEFVSLVSHELRTPLTSIMGFAQTLRADVGRLPAGEQEEFLGIIEQESNRLLVMINDLLDMSRMEAGRPLPMRYEEVELRGLAERVVRFQRVTTTAHEFGFAFPEGGLAVEADRDKVEQIVTNLVSNAIKYSPRGGEVMIGGSEEGEEVVLFIRDEGLGMTEEQVGRLFQPYQRVDRDAIKGIRGTGLGLYLVRGLVEAHGGKVWVESKPGKGSTFFVSLPRRRAVGEAGV